MNLKDSQGAAGARSAIREPIAILSMACRVPGANSPEEFWNGLLRRYRPTRPLPDSRRALGLEDAKIPRGLHAAFLDDVDRFDAAFFGISPREAMHLDPQHRIFLEVAAEALERAGQPWNRLAATRTGVFLGIYSNEYAWLPGSFGTELDVHSASGAGPGIAPNRLSYFLDLRGPSFAVDTTCSSSLVATHLAVQSLRAGESELAIVGGTSLILSPDVAQSVALAIPIAHDARCKVFEAAADGAIRGEGCVVYVLKRLTDALRDADPIDAVILGSAVNQDGRSNGLTAPNPEAQVDVIELALKDAGISVDQLAYVEAHGTGTQLGDEIELESLLEVLKPRSKTRGPCLVGSIKANVGHLEAAAGAAGLMRGALTLKNGSHAPHPLEGRIHPLLESHNEVLTVATSGQPIRQLHGAAVGVSAFSLGGTNAHVVLGPPPTRVRSRTDPRPEDSPSRPYLFPISARSRAALELRIRQLQQLTSAHRHDVVALQDLAFTLCKRSTHHSHRHTFVAKSWEELDREISYVVRGFSSTGASMQMSNGSRVAFVFPGHGAQWSRMAHGLIRTEPVFRRAIERFDSIVQSTAHWSLMELLTRDDELHMASATHGHPALVAVELALAELLASWGIRPAAVVGYSAGEVTAMVLSGMVPEAEAIRLCARRGSALEAMAARGGMLAVKLTASAAADLIQKRAGTLALAAITGPETCVISGITEDLRALQRELDAKDVLCIDVGVPYLFHHPQTAELSDRLNADPALKFNGLGDPTLPFYSSISGTRLKRAAQLDSAYWSTALSGTVQFHAAIKGMLADGICSFVEVAPSPVLTTDIREAIHAAGISGQAVPTLRRFGDSQHHLAMAAAACFDVGYPLEFDHFLSRGSQMINAPLPAYPWDERRFWWPNAASIKQLDGRARVARNPGTQAADASAYRLTWTLAESVDDDPAKLEDDWLNHACRDQPVDPAVDEYASIEPQVDALCGLFAARAVRELQREAAASTAEELVERLRLQRPHARLVRRLCEIASADGYLDVTRGQLEWVRQPPDTDSSAHLTELIGRHPVLKTELQMLRRCGEKLASVIRGDTDPLSLLFPNANADSAAALFGESGIARVMNGMIGRAVQHLLEQRADAKGIRIFEVGAGTGGTTGTLQAILAPHNVHYCCTDISKTLLKYTARRFESWRGFETRAFNVSLDPASQGLQTGSYDIVIAANVLHATPDVRESVLNCQRLLRPGGTLLLLEATRPQRIIDLTFGLTRDWWGYDDSEVRANHPLLNAASWCDILRGSQFEAVQDAPRDSALAERLDMAVISGTKSLKREAGLQGTRWLAIAAGGEFAREVTEAILEHDGHCEVASIETVAERLGKASWDGVIDLRCIDSFSNETWSAERLLHEQENLQGGLLRLVTSLSEHRRLRPRLFFVTCGAVTTERFPSALDVLQASFRGTIATLAAEHPEWQPRVIDCELADPRITAARIVSELAYSEGPLQIAYRAGQKYWPRVTKVSLPEADAQSLVRPDRSYLITGGLGALGLELADWLAACGARHLILAQRSRLEHPILKNRVAALAQKGVSVDIQSVDLAAPKEAASFVRRLRQLRIPLAGVIHAAGSFDDCLLATHSWDRFERVLAPKVVGAWELHRGLAEIRLDFFVLFSSAAEMLDPVGAANYVSANAFLETLAARRRAQGLPATCVAWGGWVGLGMAGKMSQTWEKRWASRGVRGLEIKQSFDFMARAIASEYSSVYAIDVNWQQFALGASEHQRAILGALLPTVAPGSTAATSLLTGTDSASSAASAGFLMRSPPRPGALRGLVRQHALSILELPSDFELPPDMPFADLGLDSMMSLELRDVLSRELSLPLPATLLFDHPTLTALVSFLLAQHDGTGEGAPPHEVEPETAAGIQ